MQNEPIEIDFLSEGTHTICVNGFGEDRWQDGVDGISSMDNASCHTWRVDLTAADPVELSVTAATVAEGCAIGPPGTGSARLSWVWTSDDTQEVLKRYRVWFSKAPIDEATLPLSEEVFCDLVPGPMDVEENFIISGLRLGIPYYFAIKSIDMAKNESGMSNVATLTLESFPPAIDSVALQNGGLTTNNADLEKMTITGANFTGG